MVDEITPIFDRIRRNYGHLSCAKSKVARFMLDHWDEAAFLSAARMGEAVGVSESVVIRLASDLGYSGYSKMQQEFQKIAMSVLQSTMVQRLDSKGLHDSYDSLLVSCLDRTTANVKSVYRRNTSSAIKNAATALIQARDRYVIGLRASYGPAACLGINLNQMIGRTHVINLGAGNSYDQLRTISSQDSAIGITLYRYSVFTYDLLKMVKDRGGKVISITDDLLAPVSQISDYTLVVDSQGFSYGHSHAGTMALLDVLLETVVFLDRQRVRKNLADTEEVLAEYSHKRALGQAGRNEGGG